MRVGLVGHAMGRPARVADADRAVERLALQPALEIDQLAFGAAAAELAVLDGGDAGRVIAAIFEPLQRIDDQRRDRRVADNSNDSAHDACPDSRQMPSTAIYGEPRRCESQFAFRSVSAVTASSLRRPDRRYGRIEMSVTGDCSSSSPPPPRFSRSSLPLPGMVFWRARPKASASSGTSSVIDAARGDIGAVADRDRRHQRGVRADEGALRRCR